MNKETLSAGNFAGWIGVAVVLAVSASPAGAVQYNFSCITGNDPTNCAVGESQLLVDVSDEGGGQVRFTFSNVGLFESSITDIYFDDAFFGDGPLAGIASLIDADDGTGGDAGVDFSEGARPKNLPGGNQITPKFEATESLSADSDSPVAPLGVDPGEMLAIIFDLQLGSTFADVIAELASGELRIGLHVQAFANGGSESFVNGSSTAGVVPEPHTVLLFGTGLLALGLLSRRRAEAAP